MHLSNTTFRGKIGEFSIFFYNSKLHDDSPYKVEFENGPLIGA